MPVHPAQSVRSPRFFAKPGFSARFLRKAWYSTAPTGAYPHPWSVLLCLSGGWAGHCGKRPTGACGRGGTGRRTGFRFQRRKAWGFDSLRPHHVMWQESCDKDSLARQAADLWQGSGLVARKRTWRATAYGKGSCSSLDKGLGVITCRKRSGQTDYTRVRRCRLPKHPPRV